MTIYERALEFVPDGAAIGLGSGRASAEFIRLLGERTRTGRLHVRGVPTSGAAATVAKESGVALIELADVSELAVTVDGADEVDPRLNLIKGYGRALVREKVVAAYSKRLVVLVGEEKLVPQLGSRGRLPVEVLPFALPLCLRRIADLGLKPAVWEENGQPGRTDNGNFILDCATGPIADPSMLEGALREIPGVVGTGLFLGMAHTVLIGDPNTFLLKQEQVGSDG